MLREARDWLEELACRAGLDGLPSLGSASKYAVIAMAVLAAGWFALGAGAGSGGGEAAPAQPHEATRTVEASASSAPSAPASVTVHVVGEVRRPGVYVLATGARACDAVAAAGGLLGDAEQASVNLARVLVDGEQIVVPRQGESAAAGGAAGGAAGAAGTGASGKVNINSATAEQLDALPGIGPATAAKIVGDRTSNGPFSSVDDLMRVPGIGPAKFDALKDLITAG